RIRSGAGYQDRVYDQNVFVEMPDGKVIDLFDHKMLCNQEMIGKIKNITISVSLANLRKVTGPIYNVIPAETESFAHKKSGCGHIFNGKLIDKDEKYKEFIIDIGCGLIYSDSHGHFNDFQIGDFLEIYAVRADLRDIQ
ncbi:hypothetical protein, partial [Methanocella conradii]|uniref:hypothetical protein n=1 Tax=Methanocella conradii TaxID=1175444 RepID=UPI0024B321EC